VLKREPDNEVALEGLANTYIATDNFKEAIEPLEKLVKLNLGRSDYANLLKESKQKADGHS
jgi:cytochrome c-type biogenesis protein CcmH/NrfG